MPTPEKCEALAKQSTHTKTQMNPLHVSSTIFVISRSLAMQSVWLEVLDRGEEVAGLEKVGNFRKLRVDLRIGI